MFVRGRSGNKGAWLPDKIKGEGFGKSLSARAGVGMESYSKMSGCGVRIFSKMTAENPMLSASHCHQIYCRRLKTWHIRFKP